MRYLAVSLLWMVILSLHASPAQAQVVRGVVWHPSSNGLRDQAELYEMKESGVEAIRTPLLLDQTLYEVADSLGIQLYQDLPFEYLPAKTLLDTLDYARSMMREAVLWAAKHASVRTFGLGWHNDSSDPEACRFFEEVIKEARIHASVPLSFYHVTTFIEDEQCVAPFDAVLLDALNEPDPITLLQRWRTAHPEGNVGIGALGTWVEAFESDQDGYKLQHSPAYQARYLEDKLHVLLKSNPIVNPSSVFVYRWNDTRFDYPSVSHNLSYPYRDTYGLKTNRGANRSAYYVVKGIFTGEQEVFAFPVGHESNQEASWIVLLGWISIALLGFGYAYFPRFSPNAKRYFAAHGFYRAAVEEGRELLFGSTALLLFVVMIAFGIAGAVILDTVRVTQAFSVIVRWLPPTPRSTLLALLANQQIMILVLGSGFAVAVTTWTSILSVVTARNRRRLLPGQTFMLVVWPQWQIIITMIAAMVISTLDNAFAFVWALALLVILVVAVLTSVMRALRDYLAITKASMLQTCIVLFANPFLLLMMAGVYICLQHIEKFRFVWHLMMRT